MRFNLWKRHHETYSVMALPSAGWLIEREVVS
jgi:hypothetical protein